MRRTVTAIYTVVHPTVAGAKRSRFKTLEEWLISICDGKKPDKKISAFVVNLSLTNSTSYNGYTVFLYGEYTYLEERITRVEFEPSNMFLALPKQPYKNLDYEKIKQEITDQLKVFTQTEKFKHSFLSGADIRIGFNGEKIWEI